MGMTLKQAFTLWANAPRNVVLAAKSREAVQRVLMKKWNDIDLEQITPAFAERIFSQSSEPKEMKIKAASILVYLLQWGGDNGHCQRPTFDYTIANTEPKEDKPKEDRTPMPKTLAEISGRTCYDAQPANHNDKPNEETIMEQEKKPRGKQPKPVAQIDPKTLKVVKVWPSRCEAERQLGACNLDRCIAKHRMSAGFYWCAPEDADTFKPNPLSGNQPKPAKPKQEVSPSTGDATRRGQSPCSPSATTHTGDSPRVSHPAAADALAVFSDDELLEELDRRGWEGELSRRQVVTIGAK